MSTKNEIESFLKDFNLKMQIWDILFRDERGKNVQTLYNILLNKNKHEKSNHRKRDESVQRKKINDF